MDHFQNGRISKKITQTRNTPYYTAIEAFFDVTPLCRFGESHKLESPAPMAERSKAYSRVHSLRLLVDHCVLRNWDRILVRAVKGLISRAGMVSICPLL